MTDNPEMLEKVQCTLKNALKSLQNKTEEKTEYISKKEVMHGICEKLTEMFRAQRTGKQLRPAEEVAIFLIVAHVIT